MSHSKEINTTNMNDLEEGEISNDKIIIHEKNISGDYISTKLQEDQSSQNEEESQGFFHKLKPSTKKEPKEEDRNYLSRKRDKSLSPRDNQGQNYKKPYMKFQKNPCQYYSRNGFCTKGNDCRFAHIDHQAQPQSDKRSYNSQEMVLNKNYKRDLCKYYVNGSCLKGDNCTFSHYLKDFPCKYYQVRGHCDNRDHCKDEMIKFIKDHEQFIDEIKTKYGSTKIDSYYKYYMENKTNLQNSINTPQQWGKTEVSNSNIIPNQSVGQNWMGMNMGVGMGMGMNPNMFQIQQQQSKALMMGYPMFNNPMPSPNMQFFPMAMNLSLSMPGPNQFMAQNYFQGPNNTGLTMNASSQKIKNDLIPQKVSKEPKIKEESNNESVSNSNSSKSSLPEISSNCKYKTEQDQPEGEKTKKIVHQTRETNLESNEDLIKKVVNAFKQNSPQDPRLKK